MKSIKKVIAVIMVLIMTVAFVPQYKAQAKNPDNGSKHAGGKIDYETKIEDEDSTDKTGYWVIDTTVNWDSITSPEKDTKYSLSRGVLYENGKIVAKLSRGAVAPAGMFRVGNYIVVYGGRFGVAMVDLSNRNRVKFIGPNNMFKSSKISVNDLKYTVDNNGKVTLYMKYTGKDGVARIYRYESSTTSKITAVKSVTLDKEVLSLGVGESQALVATVNPSTAVNKNVTWTSSNSAVATVDSNGKVTGVKEGEAVIFVITEDGAKTDTCRVKVGNTSEVKSVSLNKETLTLKAGESETLTAAVSPSNAANKNLVWVSLNPDVASVDQNGKVTALKAGSATIVVITQDGVKIDTCVVTVGNIEAVSSVTLDREYLTLLLGESQTLTATVNPSTAANKNVIWVSEDSSIATVDQNGKVTAVKEGQTNINVITQDGAKTDSCKVTVGRAINAVSVTLNKETLALTAGQSETLTAVIDPTNATNKNISWSSSNTSVATVDANGKVTAVSAGEAIIIATTQDGGKTDSCKVTVTANN